MQRNAVAFLACFALCAAGASAALSPVRDISVPSPAPSTPDVAAQGSNVYIVWSERLPDATTDVFFRRSINEGRDFGEIVKLSGPLPSQSTEPRITAEGQAVYVVWTETLPGFKPAIFFAFSIDSGRTWSVGFQIFASADGAVHPVVAAAGPEVYVAFEESTSPRQILFLRSTNRGLSFDPFATLLSDPLIDSFDPSIAAAGSNVYLAWTEPSPQGGSGKAIAFRRSITEGADFLPRILLAIPGAHPTVAAVGSTVAVGWEDVPAPGGAEEITFVVSTDAGAFGLPFPRTKASSSPEIRSLAPRVAVAGSTVALAWQDELPAGPIAVLCKARVVDITAITPCAGGDTTADAATPAIAVTGSSLYVVWVAHAAAGPLTTIRFRRELPNSAPVAGKLPADPIESAVTPSIVADGSDVYAAWTQTAATGQEVFVSHSNNRGESFSDRFNLSDASGDSSLPQIAAAGSTAVAVWQDDSGLPDHHRIAFKASRNRGETWPVFASDLSVFPAVAHGDSRAPYVAAVGSEVYVVWQDTTGTFDGLPMIFMRWSKDQGQTWTPLLTVAPHQVTTYLDTARALTPSVAATGSNVYLAWKERDASGHLMIAFGFTVNESGPSFFRSKTAASEPPAILTTVDSDPGLLRIGRPRIAASGSRVYVVWQQDDRILFRRVDVGGEETPDKLVWAPPLAVDARPLSIAGAITRAPVVAAVGSEVYVAWQRTTAAGGEEIEFIRSVDEGKTFSAVALNISANPSASVDPSVAAAGADVHLAWSDDAPPAPALQKIFFRSSNDEGLTFTGCGAENLSAAVSDKESSVSAGGSVTVTATVSNSSCGGSVRPKVGVTSTPILVNPRWCLGPGCTPSQTGPVELFADLGPGQQLVIIVEGTVSPLAAGTLTHVLTVTLNDSVITATDQTAVTPGMSVSCSASGGAFEGGTIVYTFVLANHGSVNQGDNPGHEFTDVFPPGLTVLSAGASQGTISFAGNTVTWNGAIPAGGSATFDVTAAVSPGTYGTTLCNQAIVTFDSDGDGVNDSTTGTGDSCCVLVRASADIPLASPTALLMLAAILGMLALVRLRS